MKADSIFDSYYEGNWSEFAAILEEKVGNYAEAGNVVRLSRAFSYYGAVSLMNSNEFLVSTLYKQMNEEYVDTEEDPRIKASYARFLALYHSFYGRPEDASKYYMEARLFYRQTDWYLDEAIALLESVYWYYLFYNDSSELYSVLGRLKILNNCLDGYFDGELKLLDSITQKNISVEISYSAMFENLHTQSFSMMAKILISFIRLRDAFLTQGEKLLPHKSNVLTQASGFLIKEQQKDCLIIQMLDGMSEVVDMINRRDFRNVDGMMNALRGKVEMFRHPWYREQFNRLQSCFTGIKSNQSVSLRNIPIGDNHIADRISISLFEKCQLSCKNAVFNIDNLGTRIGEELLLYLATRNNLQVHKEVLVELFFPDEAVEKSYNRLYVNIHRLNKALQEHFRFLDGSGFIFIKHGIACINADILEDIDVEKYRKVLSVANQLWINDREASIELMQQAAGMYCGDVAPGFYYLDWLEDYRMELKNMQTKALHRIFRYYQSRHIPNACSDAFYSLIELDPLNEDYYIGYINCILEDERDAEAINLYNQYENRLKKELGLSPSAKLKSLITRICEVGQ